MTVYYNEIEPYAAAWLRALIAEGHIAPGEVDERSIADVRPDDLLGFAQCHFFAGVGVWSYALRRAGWSDDLPVWTGSCPCQPFSAAGRGEGFADERHLWPAFHHLIAQRRPPVVFGEQVASKAVDPWIDLVQDDMEGLGYAFGAVPFPSAGVGAPHIRDRAYFVAHAESSRGRAGLRSVGQAEHGRLQSANSSTVRELANPKGGEQRRLRERGTCDGPGELSHRGHGAASVVDDALGSRLERQRGGHPAALGHGQGSVRSVAEAGELGGLADADHDRCASITFQGLHDAAHHVEPRGHYGLGHNSGPGPTNGFWRDPDWLHCRDGRWRPVEPGTFPLAHGAPARVGRLRAYGNAINAEAAAAFIAASMDVLEVAP